MEVGANGRCYFQKRFQNIPGRTVCKYICTKIVPYGVSKWIGNEILEVSEPKESKCSKMATYMPLYKMHCIDYI